jgi:hypothetical protein
VDITIRDSIDDLFEESGHGAWQSSLRLAGEVDVTIGDSVEEKRMSCSTVSLRRSGYYDWRFCWRLV